MILKSKREIRTKGGTVFDKGHSFDVQPGANRAKCISQESDARVVIPYVLMHKFFGGFKQQPTTQTLMKWENNAFCKTPRGEKVELDGHDHDGFPSWALIMGLV